MALAGILTHNRGVFSGFHEGSARLFSSAFLRSFAGALAFFILAILLAGGWAWMNAEDTRVHRSDSVPEITIPLDWDALAPPPALPETKLEPHTEHIPETSSLALARAPIPGLFETTEHGLLPVIRATDGLTPFEAYRRSFNPAHTAPSGGRGLVSIVVLDMGLSQTATTSAIKDLSPDISLALNPYAAQPDFWQDQARAAGHELWLILPTPAPGSDPGPQALSDSAGLETNGNRLLWALGRMTGYPGIIIKSSGALESSTQGENLRAPLFTRGLAIADLAPVPSQTIEVAAIAVKAKYTSGAKILDSDLRAQAIRESLESLESAVIEKGHAIGVLSPSPVAYQEISKWIETLPRKNIILAPLSAQMTTSEHTQETQAP